MLRFIVLAFILNFSKVGLAQVIDNFADGNFTQNPTWQGDDSLWQVNGNFQLQSKGTLAKDIQLVTQSNLREVNEWQFFIRFNFNPSAQNFCRFYLSSDQLNLRGNLNGYYIQFGGSTGNTDSVSLYKQEGARRTRIIAGRPATVVKTNNLLNIKVTKDSLGLWRLFTDTGAVNNFILEDSVVDNSIKDGICSGIFARFTSSNASAFYLDNVYIGKTIVDTEPPRVQSFNLTSDSSINIMFTEQMNIDSVLNKTSFVLNNQANTISKVNIAKDLLSIELVFKNSFTSPSNNVLLISDISDKAGNKMLDTSLGFLFYKPKADDVIFNEVMADPSPSNGLPDAEYIELFNRTNFEIDLENWKLNDLTSTITLPKYILEPNGYVILVSQANENLFKPFGKTLPIALPNLNNDGDRLQLIDNRNNIINQISYNLSWYKSSIKSAGGWSLEMKNPFILCQETDNWSASENSIGGTPGKINENAYLGFDTILPQLKSWKYLDEKNLELVFNEKMDVTFMAKLNVSVNQSKATSFAVSGVRNDTVKVTLSNAMLKGQNYLVNIDSAFDCSLNKINPTTFNFVFIPITSPKQNDLIITEIYANPKPNNSLPDAEYIELHNRSTNIISLKNINLKKGNNIAALPNYLLYPDSFVAICDDSKLDLFNNFKNVIAVSSFPSLSLDDELVLLNNENYIIHQIAYKQDWYKNNLKADGGWSLEMIDVNNPCGLSSNWAASKNAKGGTIGFVNSVNAKNADKTPPILSRIYPAKNNVLELYFDKTLDSSSICFAERIKINPSLGSKMVFDFKDDFLMQCRIILEDSIKANQTYTIKIESVTDCAGNLIDNEASLSFGQLKAADSGDVIINEILFNPRPSGTDFIEIYNTTNQFLDLKNVLIGNKDAANQFENFYMIADSGFMLLPQNYYVITNSANTIKQEYYAPNNKNFIELNNMPSMNDDEGNIVLFKKDESIIDGLSYDEKMHFALIDNNEGISLERINMNVASNLRTNWTSASKTSNFATPTYKNSQYLNSNQTNAELNIQPEVFTPNNDGFDDNVSITYKLDNTNYTGTLQIFNSNGKLVKTLLNNTPLGTEGTVLWNGLSENNEALPIGIYILYFDYFNLNGSTKTTKKPLVIGKTY